MKNTYITQLNRTISELDSDTKNKVFNDVVIHNLLCLDDLISDLISENDINNLEDEFLSIEVDKENADINFIYTLGGPTITLSYDKDGDFIIRNYISEDTYLKCNDTASLKNNCLIHGYLEMLEDERNEVILEIEEYENI